MIAIISTNKYIEEIEKAVSVIKGTIVYKSVDNALNINLEMMKLRTVPFNVLIIDISCFAQQKEVITALKRLRIYKDQVRIIVIASGINPGDPFFASVVNLGIYDIVLDNSDIDFVDVLTNPKSFKDAIRLVDEEFEENKEQPKGKLVEKVIEVEKEKIIGPVVIAVAGTMKRIGTTHTVISMAKYLSEKYKVAVVELGCELSAFTTIRSSYDVKTLAEDSFLFNNIYFYQSKKFLDLALFESEDFKYVILDMGTYLHQNSYEFWRAHSRVLISGSKDWELSYLEEFLKDNDNQRKVKYLFNFTDNESFENIKAAMHPLECYQFPYNPQLFKVNNEAVSLFDTLLENVLPKRNTAKNNILEKIFAKIK